MTAAMPVRHEMRGRAVLVTIDNPPVNVIGQAVRAGLAEALDFAAAEIGAGRAERVVLTGAGRAFVAGADAKEFDGPALEPHLPDVLARIMALPAVAAINGSALGGGFEIALACRVRIAAPDALLGLPEVTLGVVPGSGGTQRLPRLIGLSRAVPLVASGRLVKGDEAEELGLVDQLAEDPLAAALEIGMDGRLPVDALPAAEPDAEAIEAARAASRKRQKGQTAPLKAIELMAGSAEWPLQEGLARERETFLNLRAGPQARALRHMFFAERAAGMPPALRDLPARQISSALVAGGGTMGAAIAYALSNAGIGITLLEHDAEAAARARDNVAKLFDDAVRRGKLASAEAARRLEEQFSFLHGTDAALPPVDLAVEAVFEDLAVKRALFDRLSAELPDSTILATNTSYLDPDEIAAGIRAPERFLGLHFFAPAHVMRLLEIVRTAETSPRTLAAGFALARRLGKVAVEAGICDGFIGNRILKRYRQTADIMLIEGALPWEIDAALTGFGMAMGVYAAQDLSGLDIAHANRRRKGREAGTRHVPIADLMVEKAGRLGRKTGAGWYDYEDGRAVPSAAVAELVVQSSQAAGLLRRNFPPEEIQRRMMLAMMMESFDILGEGIAARAADIDLVEVHGYGFPRWRGGPMKLAEEWGLAAVAGELAALSDADPASWHVPPLLERLARGDGALWQPTRLPDPVHAG
ncbi:3-hydroxyacyl-CoA dehydrogenase NAD-binding domain-containing protein [Poseidonocella sp. HB161398]|uniref:3-hydroxyacyl-CoA dehydrogenase NAD-binding domain-containing protein n=1 Tax=Poseidonocella sp. HB161398 TaxID=2320855 RepID=UPI001109379D|nr:3-hydroxyacyl-CoA dehydrogenase NAD-binding domain-containing protein [Poseidonocella sp. HB161398]